MNIKLIFIIAKTWPINMERYIYIYIYKAEAKHGIRMITVNYKMCIILRSLSLYLSRRSFFLDWIVMYNV